MIGRRFLPLLLLIFIGLAALADAAPPPMLRATVNELAPRSRRTAPDWVEVLLSSRATGIREGALEFAMIEWNDVIYRYRTHEIVINSGDQRFRFMLPAASFTGDNLQRTLELRFIEKNGGTTHLGEFPLGGSLQNGSAHVIAVIRSGLRDPAAETYPLWQALRVERVAPDEGRKYDTTPIFFEATDLPIDPLGIVPFDIVLIESDALAKMREKARVALAQWVNAGGSVCIMADRGLEPEDVDAINQLASVDPRWKPLTVDEEGRVKVPGNLALARVNLGRMAIMAETPPENAETVSPAWRKASVFLWRLLSGPAGLVERNGKWKHQEQELLLATMPEWQVRRFRAKEVEASSLEAPVWEVFPKSVRVIPLWIMATVIGVFVLLIGPVDWFVLGAIRRHRFTWIVFPATAILVTVGTVLLVQRFMGSADQVGSVIISDIGANGRIVRETRLELQLPASQDIETTPVKSALRLPIHSNSRTNQWRNPSLEAEAVTYHGQYPSRFDYIRTQRQWNPEISRVTTIVDQPDTSGISWDVFDYDFLKKNLGVFQSGMMSDGRAHIAHPKFDRLVEQATGVADSKEVTLSFFTQWGFRETGIGPTSVLWRNAITLATETSECWPFTHVSPNGFTRCDDLKMLEFQDPSRTVVLASVRDGGTIRVWRRLYLHK